jgi:hypothetical protein
MLMPSVHIMAENGSVSEWCVLIAELFFLKEQREIFGLGFSNTVVRVISASMFVAFSVGNHYWRK